MAGEAAKVVGEILDLGDVSWHGKTNRRIVGCELTMEADIGGSCPVNLDFVQKLEGIDEVLSPGLGGILDTEIINDECEHGAIGRVLEEARCVGLCVALSGQELNEALWSQGACFRHAVHAF